MRLTLVFGIAALIGLGFGVYRLKYRVLALSGEVADLERQIAAERDSIHHLRAEWAFLNRPDRLSMRAKNLLRMAPIPADRIVTAEDLPAAGANYGEGETP